MKFVQFTMIVRGWYRSGMSSVISLVSLGIGLICATILLLFVVDQYRVATSLGTSDDIYILEQKDLFTQGQQRYTTDISKGTPLKLSDRFAEVEQYTVFKPCYWEWQYDETIDWKGDATIAATVDLPKMVNIKMVKGSLESVLAHPDQIALTQSYANRIFPGKDPIGQSISSKTNYWTNNQKIVDEKIFIVSAIIDDSEKSFLKLRGIFLLDNSDLTTDMQFGSYHSFIKLRHGTEPNQMCKKVASDSTLNMGPLNLRPLTEVYFKEAEEYSVFHTQNENTLWIGTTIAFAILLIAAFNYINITMIRAPRRLKNLAGQRIMGASKWNIRWQIVTDTAFNVAVAFSVALICMPPSMRLFNSFMGSNLQLTQVFELRNIPYIVLLLIILVGLPALNLVAKMAIRNPLEVFKNPKGRKLQAMQTLVIVQFVISVVLIAFSLNVGRQMDFVAQTIPGGNRMLQIESSYDGSFDPKFINRLVADATTTDVLYGSLVAQSRIADGKGEMHHEAQTFPNYFDFLGIKLLSGRTLDSIPTEGASQIVANETFIKQNQIKGDPIGAEVESNGRKYHIVGVCQDVMMENYKIKIQPTIYLLNTSKYGTWSMTIRYTGSTQDKIDQINRLYTEIVTDNTLRPTINTVQDFLIAQNPEIKRLQTMVWIFALISILLTAIGMFGLSWYTVEHRRKEIAIRKIHGASTNRMVGMLATGFLRWVAIATVIALPTSYFISGYWLDGFAYRVDNSIAVLVITALFITIVTFVTVIYQTVRVARTNPANTIKTE